MTRAATILVLLLVTACGGQTPPAQPPIAQPGPTRDATPEPPPLLVEYVVIRRRWVETFVPTPAPEVQAWSASPENAEAVAGSFRHILVKAPADATDSDVLPQRKKAQGILDRIKKGEDFAKLAKQLSDDPGSKNSGGEYGAEKVKDFVEPVRNTFATLKPGETAPELVRSKFGFHVIKKDRASDEQIERSYRKARAPELTRTLGADLLGRLKEGAPSRSAIADATLAVLGEAATNDANRPKALIVDREHLKQAHLPAAARAALETFATSAHPGDALPSPAVDGDTIVVARALAPGDRDR